MFLCHQPAGLPKRLPGNRPFLVNPLVKLMCFEQSELDHLEKILSHHQSCQGINLRPKVLLYVLFEPHSARFGPKFPFQTFVGRRSETLTLDVM
uniref:Uncharacterized protein n=1 Tax=Romanomermis culicivorax TaxID=13658 RepID=A0A915L3D7_ROMCU